jgi:acyl-CoA thioesterase-1
MTNRQLILFVLVGISLIILGIVFFYFSQNNTTSSPPQTKEPAKQFTIAAFGDSLTAGYGVDLSESYPYILEQRLKEEGLSMKVINMGVSGETTSGGLERVAFVIEQNPDIILLGLGANDMLRSLPPSLVKTNLDSMIRELLAVNKKIVLLGMKSSITNGAAYRKEFDTIYEDLAKQYSLPLVPFILEGVALRPSLNTSDGIHPNKAGYEKMVDENILPILLPYLKKSL